MMIDRSVYKLLPYLIGTDFDYLHFKHNCDNSLDLPLN